MRKPARFLLALAAGIILAANATAKDRPAGAASKGHPLLMISIDGLRPGDVSEAEARGLRIPNLRRLLTEGAHASSVTGVLPTLTYPSHTTLITGAAPARHGILANTTFDPTAINADGWYWYSSDIHRPTLWDAARAHGFTTGNVHWPVSVGAKAITWNLPQIWRTGHADDAKLLSALATLGLLPELEKTEGPYAAGIDESIEGDEKRGRFAARLIALHHPDFLTVYLTALDHTQHAEGPDTAAAHAALERIDSVVGRLIAAEKAAHPDAVVALVSDHGFAPVDAALNLSRAFIDAGLMRVETNGFTGKPQITGWEASAWATGGSFAIMLARPDDAALRGKVRALLEQLKADPANRIERIIPAEDIARAGGNPDAAFYVNLGPGMMALPFINAQMPLRTAAPYKGMHGYFPDDPRMRSTFLLMGPGVPKGRDLGAIDMRAIAPTLARIMGAKLPEAEVPAVRF